MSVHHYWKNHTFEKWTFVGKVISLPFHMLSRFVRAFFPRSKCLLISLLQSPSTVILEPRKIKFVTVSIFPQLFAMKWWDQMPWSLFFECWVFKPTFSLFSFTFLKRLFSSSSFSPIRVVSSVYLRLLIFPLASRLQPELHSAWHLAWCTLHIS